MIPMFKRKYLHMSSNPKIKTMKTRKNNVYMAGLQTLSTWLT